MTSDTTIHAETRPTWKSRKRKGAGKPAPSIVFNGANILGEIPRKQVVVYEFSQEMGDRICDWLAEGRSLRTFCFQDGAPHIQTVRRWLDANPDFAARYARAKDEGMDVLAELAKDEATANVPPEQVQAARLAFDARRWYASKIAPRRYADKLDVKQEISGPGGGPLTLQVDVLVSMLLTPANLERLTDVEVESIRSAAAKLALPVPADPVIEGEAVPVEPSEGAGDS